NEEFFRRAEDIAEEIKRRASKVLGDCEVYIVGSYARGEHTLSSDLDVLIISDAIPERYSFEWYVSVVRNLTDDPRVNVHLLNPKRLRELEALYRPMRKV
ncbi:MAG TPA: nucleotidyltransferase domain-containing protein, partial [Candidatus Korarchaeota archaeon]|nr:nucleotidyltransferase domain-containing protein [Candidatus Korarchaeota archaeon]